MIGLTNAGSGGGGTYYGDYAYISVQYPPGSTVTCSDGETTMEEEGGVGIVVFGLPNAGEWEITITDGEDTVTKTVTVTEEGQVNTIVVTGYMDYVITEGRVAEGFTMATRNASVTEMTDATDGTKYMKFHHGAPDYGQEVYANGPIWTAAAIPVEGNTKAVIRVRATVSTSYLRIWDGDTETPDVSNSIASAALTAKTVELAIPSGYETIKFGTTGAYGNNIHVLELYLSA